jgi:hypothetical protein
MITVEINGRHYRVINRLSEVTTKHLDAFAGVPVPKCYEKLILTGEVDHLTIEDVKTVIPDYLRKVLQVLSTIPAPLTESMSYEIVNGLSNLYSEVTARLIMMDFDFEQSGIKSFFSAKEPAPGYSSTAWQVCEAQDVITESRQAGLRFLPMIYRNWSEKKMLLSKRVFNMKEVSRFFFITFKSLKSLAKGFRLFSRSRRAKQENAPSKVQVCGGLCTNFQQPASVVFLN